MRKNLHRAKRMTLRQFRYVLFLKRNWRSRLRLPVRPYLKSEGEEQALASKRV